MRDLAIRNTHPSVVSIMGGAEAFDADGAAVTIDEALVAPELDRLQAAYAALDYSRSRKSAYDLLNQDEMRYDDLVNSTTTWPDAIAAIKQEFPK